MATTLIPPGSGSGPEAAAPRPLPAGNLRFVAIRANLLPDEVISARQADVVRRRVLIALAAVVAILLAGYGFSWLQTSSARDNLSTQHHRADALTSQQRQYAPLVTAQAQTQSIQAQLHRLMVGDLSWTAMLTTLRAQAPSGISLTSVTGVTNAGAAASTADGGYSELNQSGKQQVGTLTVIGTAPNKDAIAAYADRLGDVLGLTAPVIASVATATTPGHQLTFSVTALITSDALGGRYATPAPSAATPSGGK